jgi:hypothetical protein
MEEEKNEQAPGPEAGEPATEEKQELVFPEGEEASRKDSKPPMWGEGSQVRFKMAVDKLKDDVPRESSGGRLLWILLLLLLVGAGAFALLSLTGDGGGLLPKLN